MNPPNLIIGIIAFIVGIACLYKAYLYLMDGNKNQAILGIYIGAFNLMASAINFCQM